MKSFMHVDFEEVYCASLDRSKVQMMIPRVSGRLREQVSLIVKAQMAKETMPEEP